MRYAIKIVSLLLLINAYAFSQNLNKQIQSLENDFRQFKYEQVIEKGRFLLADSYASKKDSLQIYQFMLSSAYALDDTIMARSIIKEILRTEPSFTLDARNTSPKIIEFFNYIKQQIVHKEPPATEITEERRPPLQKQVPPLKASYLVAAALFPGSGHWLSGEKNSGYMRSAASAALLAGIVYTAVETNRRHDAYLSASAEADFDSEYNRYNAFYKLRNTLLIGYGLWSLYNLYDLQQRHSWQVTVSGDSHTLSMDLSIRW